MKVFIALRVSLLAALLQGISCSQREESPIVKWKGPNDPTHLIFFYKKGATYEQKDLFQKTVIHKPHPGGGGDLADGVVDLFSLRNSGYEGYGINFSENATPEQRAKLKAAIESSPIVYKVFEDVVPDTIKLE